MQPVRIRASDGFELGATLYGDPARARCGVLIAPAMGVAQPYYADFARWLAADGCAVLAFDYRGIGASRPATGLRGFDADVDVWAERDAAAALRFLERSVRRDTPILWLGHSLGAQIFGLVPNRERVSRLVSVSAGSGYWRDNAAPLRRVVWSLWYVIVPLVLPLAGYFPGRTLRIVGDLPAGVMAQWRRWCLHRDYLLADAPERRERYARIDTPMLSLSFTDDEFMSARSIETLNGFYAGAPKTVRRIAPADLGERRIGHFGFFRSRLQHTLWPEVTRWMTQETSA